MITINSVSDFFDFLKVNTEKYESYIFRGVKSTDYKLIPSVGRCYTNNMKPFTVHEEIIMLSSFKMKVFPYLKKEFSEIELLILAQHHGLPT